MARRRRGVLLRTLLVWSGVVACAATGQPLPYTADHPVARHAAADAAAVKPGMLSVRPMSLSSLRSPACVSPLPWAVSRLWTGLNGGT
jgi:hypothetical protein